MTATYIVGDSLTVLRSLPDASVDLVLTSPPFLALRSYLPSDHPDKAMEMGSEPTPGAFIDALLTLTEECRRVLTPHGSLCVELGDTYAGSGGAGGDYAAGGLRDGQPAFDGAKRRQKGAGRDWPQTPGANWKGERPGWPLDKSLCLIPELYRIALAYGFNPLTGRTTPRWRARNVVRWVRPNPPVGALADKFRPATSEMVVACVGRKRYFDLDAVRTPASGYERPNGADRATAPGQKPKGCLDTTNPAGAPPLDWWAIPTEPYPGSHYATMPTDLCVRPIKAMCPERVCRTCGVPSERIVQATRAAVGKAEPYAKAARKPGGWVQAGPNVGTEYVTTGWSDCGHDDYRPGLVLDPFAGSGTTLAVATGHGRDAIGIDLDARNADLARQRVGMFLTVDEPAPSVEVS